MEGKVKFRRSLVAVPAVLAIGLVAPTPAYALLSIIGSPSAIVVSAGVATGAVVGTGAVIAGATAVGGTKAGAATSVGIAAGATVIVVLDPADATFYNGSFETFFPSNLLTPIRSGWLGDWGADPSQAAPPVGVSPLPAFVIQDPNAALMTTVNTNLSAGTQAVTFDWGSSGHAETGSGDFNFYAVDFEAMQPVVVTYLGGGATPQPGANLYSDAGISCSAAGSNVVVNDCGSAVANNSSYAVRGVPEPSTWAMMLAGFAAVGFNLRRRVLRHARVSLQ